MPDYPLLVFPEPTLAERAKRQPGFGKVKIPAPRQQADRLSPHFVRLSQAMARHRMQLQGNAAGLQPEQALVLETIGPVQNFINAVQKIEGLEWLGEFEVDDISPAHGFEDEKDAEKHLKGQLFLVMTDQRALQEVLNLYTQWQQNPAVKFRRGLAPLKHAFEHLHTIRPWGAEDRIRETGVLEDWKLRAEYGQTTVPFEAELWFRQNADRRRTSAEYIRGVVEEMGGEVVGQCVISEIGYHGILGRIPVAQATEIIDQREVRLLQCEDVWHFRPVGQCALRSYDDLNDAEELGDIAQPDLPQGDPLVALLDGLPLTGHHLLDGRVVVDDPDDYESAYQAHERVHGTSMASLICHGDLDDGHTPSPRPLYVRPVMQPRRGFDGQYVYEAIPDTVLPVDLIHRAVRRLYEQENGEPPVAPNVRVINISIGDPSHPLDREMSSWARLLDWLSWKYNVLFVVSAGNHAHDIELNLPRANLNTLSAADREKAVIEAQAAYTRHRRLLSPAETVNGLTVGAVHSDASTPAPHPNLIDPHSRTGLPSPVSAHGPGYRRAIKPDILLAGGRQFYQEKMGTTHSNATLQAASFIRPPGQCVAAPGSAGELDKTIYTCGTSNAAALASRTSMQLYDVLEALRAQPGGALPSEYDVVLLKALLAHGANWGEAGSVYESILKNAQNSRTFSNYVGRFLGYGPTDAARVMACTDQRVTVLGFGALNDGEGQEFLLPLPPSLSAVTEKRRLTVTLAWVTPVNTARQSYRIAHLWFSPKHDLAPQRLDADWNAVQRGTLQHEVLEGENAVDFQDGDNMTIKVSCRSEAGDIPEPIRYGLVVTLEVAEGIDLPIYLEVRDRLRVPVRVPGGRAT